MYRTRDYYIKIGPSHKYEHPIFGLICRMEDENKVGQLGKKGAYKGTGTRKRSRGQEDQEWVTEKWTRSKHIIVTQRNGCM